MKQIYFSLGFYPLIICLLIIQCSASENPISDDTTSFQNEQENVMYPKDIINFSQYFFSAVRYEDPFEPYMDTLSRIDVVQLEKDLNSHNKKLAFWINIYNSLVQVKIFKDEHSFKDQNKFFKTRDIIIGGTQISLDDIEHGILRKKDYDNPLVKRFSIDKLDFRIHFTMNCGATSCPAIAYYKPETIQEDLSLAEHSFIVQNSVYDSTSNTLETSELLKWFQNDFGGDDGLLILMRRNGVIQNNVHPIIKYKAYDWELKSKHYH